MTMNGIIQFVVQHGYLVLFAAVFARQVGLPVPANLFLLAAGALAASGKLDMTFAIFLGVTACVLADWAWYEAGRFGGDKVLHFIHRFSPDPEAADRKSRRGFSSYGRLVLVIDKFIPGLDLVAPPMAGASRTSRFRFLVFETTGAVLWSCGYAGLGYIFSHDLNRAAVYAGRAGTSLAIFATVVLFLFAAHKLVRQHCSFRHSENLRIATGESLIKNNSACKRTRTLEAFEHGD
jgi:membrane protein DedA with SNARE-associated domain